jgi:hypothetical protein
MFNNTAKLPLHGHPTIPETLARTARPVGAITNSYIDHEDNYKRDVSFCFDLQLPADFVPVPQVVTALLGAIYPAWKAVRLQPLSAIAR